MLIDNLSYKTNTARAILSSANLFKYPQHVVWEYVTNEIQYRNQKIKPKVYVLVGKDKITIYGNGSGMDINDLKNFFTLHGENQDRKKGKPGRGKFGTGKAAAFAIANSFKISTVKDKKLYELKLKKSDIKKFASSGKEIPLNEYVINANKKTNEPNGTKIEISELSVKPNRKEIIEYIEKQIGYFKGAEVWVDNHQCYYKEPNFVKEYNFSTIKTHPELGNINLKMKIAAEALDKDEYGIKILSNRVLQTITLSGAEGKEMSNYIFGEIDCPLLDDDDQDVAATSMARDMTLNMSNSLVRSLMSFIGIHVEEIRKILVKENNERKQSEEAKKLQKEGEKISEKINQHFQKFKDKIKMKYSRMSDGKTGSALASNSGINSSEGSLTIGEEIEAIVNNEMNLFEALNNKNEKNKNKSNENKKKHLEENKNQKKVAKKVNGNGDKKSSGGTRFKVEFRENGKDNPRARFIYDENTVYINLEHPYVSDLKKGEASKDITKNILFTKICHEIAYTEYAMALVNLLYQKKYYAENTEDYLQEVREVINSLSAPIWYEIWV